MIYFEEVMSGLCSEAVGVYSGFLARRCQIQPPHKVLI